MEDESMPRLPITQPRYETTEEDGSFDSHFTDSARSLLASVDAYIASHEAENGKEKKASRREGSVKLPPETTLE